MATVANTQNQQINSDKKSSENAEVENKTDKLTDSDESSDEEPKISTTIPKREIISKSSSKSFS